MQFKKVDKNDLDAPSQALTIHAHAGGQLKVKFKGACHSPPSPCCKPSFAINVNFQCLSRAQIATKFHHNIRNYSARQN